MYQNIVLIFSACIAVIVLGILLLQTNVYVATPGYTTEVAYEEFNKAKPTCIGISVPVNPGARLHDAPGKNVCIGWLQENK